MRMKFSLCGWMKPNVDACVDANLIFLSIICLLESSEKIFTPETGEQVGKSSKCAN